MNRGHLIAALIGGLAVAVVGLSAVLLFGGNGHDSGSTRVSAVPDAKVAPTPTTTSPAAPARKYLDDFEPGAEHDAYTARSTIADYCQPVASMKRPDVT